MLHGPLLASLMLALGACASQPPAAASAPAADAAGSKTIVHIVSQNQTVTVSSSPTGLRYSLKDSGGRVLLADASAEKFAELHPELYQNIRHYIAVKSDDAPIPSATIVAPRRIPSARVYDQ